VRDVQLLFHVLFKQFLMSALLFCPSLQSGTFDACSKIRAPLSDRNAGVPLTGGEFSTILNCPDPRFRVHFSIRSNGGRLALPLNGRASRRPFPRTVDHLAFKNEFLLTPRAATATVFNIQSEMARWKISR
jgi:hypothetical protein